MIGHSYKLPHNTWSLFSWSCTAHGSRSLGARGTLAMHVAPRKVFPLGPFASPLDCAPLGSLVWPPFPSLQGELTPPPSTHGSEPPLRSIWLWEEQKGSAPKWEKAGGRHLFPGAQLPLVKDAAPRQKSPAALRRSR